MMEAIFAFGAIASIRQVTGFIYFMELLPKRNNTQAACVFFVIDGASYLLVALYFWVISTHWFYIILVAYIFQLTGAVLCWFLPESPVYLLSLGRLSDTI